MRSYVAAALTFLAVHMAAALHAGAQAAVPIGECGAETPVNNKSPLAFPASGCATLILNPGIYPKLNITGHTGGVEGALTLRCREMGTCVLGTASVVANVDGFILDGVQIRGGATGLTIKASKNVLIRRSKFIEQTSSGVLVSPGTVSDNIQIANNEFRNALLGCGYPDPSICDYLSNGTPIAQMDYGVRVYSASEVVIKDNRFGTLFNHAISLKSLVTLATITGNTFNACGRTCIELGQDSPACVEALVTGNTFKGARLLDVNINNISKATVTDNIFYATAAKIKIQPKSPDTRVIVTSPNTLQ